jgi:hypothetical protein
MGFLPATNTDLACVSLVKEIFNFFIHNFTGLDEPTIYGTAV